MAQSSLSRRWFCLGVVLVMATACKAKQRPEDSSAVGRSDVPNTTDAVVYPHGRWRLANFHQRSQTVLWLSHISVRYAKTSYGPDLRPAGWRPDPPAPDRTQGAALALALGAAAELAKNPASFADVARKYSDDVVTKD